MAKHTSGERVVCVCLCVCMLCVIQGRAQENLALVVQLADLQLARQGCMPTSRQHSNSTGYPLMPPMQKARHVATPLGRVLFEGPPRRHATATVADVDATVAPPPEFFNLGRVLFEGRPRFGPIPLPSSEPSIP